MSLPAPWVNKIFDKMTLTYGQAFLRRWQDIDLNAVKSDWAHELAGFAQQPQSIAYGLQNLPADKPPTVLEFRALCRRSPMPEVPRIEQSPAGRERIASELAKLVPVISRAPAGSRDWARRLIGRYEAGEKLTRAQIEMARGALGMKA